MGAFYIEHMDDIGVRMLGSISRRDKLMKLRCLSGLHASAAHVQISV